MKRCVDELGRVVIPMEIRNKTNISAKTLLNITTEGDKIVIEKVSDSCAYCAATDNLIDNLKINGKCLCKECAGKILNVFNCMNI